jgi:hypothetical protein
MKTQNIHPTTIKIKALYVTLLAILSILMSLLSGCNKQEEVKPISQPPSNQQEDKDKLKLPTVPIILDDQEVEAEALEKYDQKSLIYVLDKSSFEKGVIRIFTDAEKARQYRQAVEAQERGSLLKRDTTTSSARVASESVILYEESVYRGNGWTFHLGSTDIRNFRRVYPTLWWTHDIDNKISSLCNYFPYHWVVLYDLPFYGGAQFWVYPNECIPYLSTYGWNDRASSMGYVPYVR